MLKFIRLLCAIQSPILCSAILIAGHYESFPRPDASWNCKSEAELQKATPSIAIITACSEDLPHCKYSVPILQAYAECRGYAFHRWDPVVPEGANGWNVFNFGKWKFLGDFHKEHNYKWLFWAGGDTVITNMSVPLEQWADERYDMVAAGDRCCNINGDHFFLKNSAWAHDFIGKMMLSVDQDRNWEYNEEHNTEWCGTLEFWVDQARAMWLLGEGDCNLTLRRTVSANETEENWRALPADIRKHYKLVPQREMNSYDASFVGVGDDGAWQPGDFIYHAAGQSKDFVTKYAQQVYEDMKSMRSVERIAENLARWLVH